MVLGFICALLFTLDNKSLDTRVAAAGLTKLSKHLVLLLKLLYNSVCLSVTFNKGKRDFLGFYLRQTTYYMTKSIQFTTYLVRQSSGFDTKFIYTYIDI